MKISLRWLYLFSVFLLGIQYSSASATSAPILFAGQVSSSQLISEPIGNFPPQNKYATIANAVGLIKLDIEDCDSEGPCISTTKTCTGTVLGVADKRETWRVITSDHCAIKMAGRVIKRATFEYSVPKQIYSDRSWFSQNDGIPPEYKLPSLGNRPASYVVSLKSEPIETSDCGASISVNDNCLDYALYGFSSVVPPREFILPVSVFVRSIQPEERLYMVHHPAGGKAVISYGGACKAVSWNNRYRLLYEARSKGYTLYSNNAIENSFLNSISSFVPNAFFEQRKGFTHGCLTDIGTSGAVLFGEKDDSLVGLHRGADNGYGIASSFKDIIDASKDIQKVKAVVSFNEILDTVRLINQIDQSQIQGVNKSQVVSRLCLITEDVLRAPYRSSDSLNIYQEFDQLVIPESGKEVIRKELKPLIAKVTSMPLSPLRIADGKDYKIANNAISKELDTDNNAIDIGVSFKITVEGHSDWPSHLVIPDGFTPEQYAYLLSWRYADAVAAELIIQGVSPKVITVKPYGVSNQPKPTPSGVNEVLNRVAIVKVEYTIDYSQSKFHKQCVELGY